MFGFRRDAQGRATLAGALISDLLAEAGVSTPAYVYDLDAIAAEATDLIRGFGSARHVVAYAVKANSAATIIRAIAAAGAGADVVSGAELRLALACGIPPARIVMSGVGKTDAELDLAIQSQILSIQVESIEELERVAARARAAGAIAPVSIRVNPSVLIDSHAHVATGHDDAKFGIVQSDLGAAWDRIDGSADAIRAVGVSTHVGSMLAATEPYLQSARTVCAIAKARRARSPELRFVDFGGGFGIDYGGRPTCRPAEFARQALELLASEGLSDLTLLVEPGRSLVGPHGVLVARVIQTKRSGAHRWLMIDAGMNDLIRPALYGARHRIEPLDRPPTTPECRVVGPVCESADDFGAFPIGEPTPDYVLIRDAGAYGFVMASEYNGRALPSEIFASRGHVVSVSRSAGADAWLQARLNA